MRLHTPKICLKEPANQNNEMAIILKVPFKGQSIIKSLGIKVNKKNFKDGAANFKYVTIGDNKHIEKNEIIKKEFEFIENQLTAYAVNNTITKEYIKKILQRESTHGNKINDIATQYLNTLTNDNTHRRWSLCLKNINLFAPNENISAITVQWLEELLQYLRVKYEHPNGPIPTLKFIRAVVKYNNKVGIKIPYPFGVEGFRLPQYKEGTRDYLTKKEFNDVKKYVAKCNDNDIRIAGLWFIFQCYVGLRYSDIEQWDNSFLKKDKIYFPDVKTNTVHFIPLHKDSIAAVQPILFLKPHAYEKQKQLLKIIGAGAKLPYHLNTHTARHTFAVHYLEDGGNVLHLQKLMGHSDIKTTMVYAKITDKALIDEMKRIKK